jgi:hypothetical protein
VVYRRKFGLSTTGRTFNRIGKAKGGNAITLLQGAMFPVELRPEKGIGVHIEGDVWLNGVIHEEFYKNLEADRLDYEIKLVYPHLLAFTLLRLPLYEFKISKILPGKE